MPHFRLRAIKPQAVQSLSKTLIDDLEAVMGSPREDFTFEYIDAKFFHEGAPNDAYPFVEVLWFDRGQKTQDHVATMITQRVRELLYPDVDVAVIFTALNPHHYYDNAQHY